MSKGWLIGANAAFSFPVSCSISGYFVDMKILACVFSSSVII